MIKHYHCKALFIVACFAMLCSPANSKNWLRQKQAHHEYNPIYDNKDAPQQPSTFIIHKTITNIPTKEDTKTCKGAYEEDKSCDALSANSARNQTIIAGFGLFIGLGTLIAASLAALYAKHAANGAKRSADAAVLQSESFKQSLDDTRREFILTHRPRITLRSITIREAPLHDHAAMEIVISNIGTTEARITTKDLRVVFSEIPPPLGDPDLNFPSAKFPSENIAPGRTITNTDLVQFNRDDFLSAEKEFREVKNTSKLKIWVRFGYEDNLGIRRNVSTWRYFNFKTRRFIRITDADYEYED